jgi:3-oxoadipate enol-lactonase
MSSPAALNHISTPDCLLTALQTGAGPDVLILHSLLTDWTAFDPVIPWLAGSFRVTLVNLPGFHGSAPVGPSIEAHADRLAGAFDGFGLTRETIIIANGFGGTVALAMALRYGDRFGKLILSDVAAGFPPEGRKAFEVMAEKVANEGLASVATIAANRVFHADYLARHPEAIEDRRRVLLGVQPEAFIAACRALMSADLVSQLPAIANPALVLWGELDAATPPALCRIVAERIPHARHAELPRCGHCPPLEQPEAFIAAIQDFIKEPISAA